MNDVSPILDYASPRKHVRLRLPAQSSLLLRTDRDEVVLIEKLTGANGAVPALIFACFVIAVTSYPLWPISGQRRFFGEELSVWSVLASVQIFVMLLLVQQTWRSTRLTVRCAELLLNFSSPFRNRSYRFSGDDIAEMRLNETANVETPASLAEMIFLRTNGGEIRLFTDHRTTQLRELLAMVQAMFLHGEPIAPSGTLIASARSTPMLTAPAVDPMLAPAALATANRLLDRQRQVSEKLRPQD